MKHSIIDRCTNSIDIKVSCARRSTSYRYSVGCIGGLIGRAPNANKTAIRYCKNTGQLHFAGDVSVAQRSYCGGIIGYGNIPIEYCENTPSLPFVCEQDATYDDVYIGGITGQGGDSDILCCRSVMDSVVIIKCRDAMIGGIDAMRVSAYEDKIKNCYSYIGKIHVKDENSGTLYYGGILSRAYDFNTSGPKASFSNNDVEIVTGKQIEGVHDGSTSFSSSQMQTTAFLDELNMFSMFEMEGPKWTMPDNVGFPYIAEFYQPSAVRDIRTIRNSNATPIYNLRGQRLASPQKGIDIIDGKKVVVK